MTYRMPSIGTTLNDPMLQLMAPPPERLEADDFDWFAILRIVRRRAMLITVIGVCLSLVALPMVMGLYKTYRATTRIIIQAPEASVLAGSPEERPAGLEIGLEIERLTARANALAVIDRFGLRDTPEFNPALRPQSVLARASAWVAGVLGQESAEEPAPVDPTEAVLETFYRDLSVQRQGMTNVIEIGFKSGDPARAAGIANALVEIYLADHAARRDAAVASADAWLKDRVDEQEARVAALGEEASAFQKQNGIAAKEVEADATNRLDALKERSAAIALERTELKATLAELDGATGDTLTVTTPVLDKLRSDLAQRERDLVASRRTVGEKHKKTIALRSEIADLQTSIVTEIEAYRQSLLTRDGALQAQQDAITAQMTDTRQQFLAESQAQSHLAGLMQRLNAARETLDGLLQRRQALIAESHLPAVGVEVLSPASVPGAPLGPSRKILFLGVLVAAGFLALTIAVIVELLDRSVRSHEQLERIGMMVPIGLLPEVPRRHARYLVDTLKKRPNGALADCVRTAMLAMETASQGRLPRSVLVTSIGSGDGRSFVTAALARELTNAGYRVLVVDADFSGTHVSTAPLTVNGKYGLAEFLRMEDRLDRLIRNDPRSGVDLLPCGGGADMMPAQSRAQFTKILRYAEETQRIVLVDGPSLEATSSLLQLAGMIDQTVLVLRWGRTPRHLVEIAADVLATSGVVRVMTLINRVDPGRHGLYGFRDRLAFLGKRRLRGA